MSKRVSIAVVVVLSTVIMQAAVAESEWGKPRPWDHCTAGIERMPCIFGSTLYYVKDYDIYMSTWDGAAGKWLEPQPVPGPINTGANEINPCIAGGGKVLYFARYDPITDYDFYRSEWNEAKGEWGEPTKIEELSTDTQEWDIWVNDSETVAYVTTKGSYGGAASVGERDIWKSTRTGDKWGTPVNIGTPVNTAGSEWSVFVDSAGRLFIDGKRDDTVGGYDIYVAESNAASPVNVGEPINSEVDEREVASDEMFFFFSAINREGGVGSYDLWYCQSAR
ncbi:MAG TPA: hypothetical protein GX515_07915 [Firmicutes bacterium]|nr:hypothetical protein [Bacillota bacterium]